MTMDETDLTRMSDLELTACMEVVKDDAELAVSDNTGGSPALDSICDDPVAGGWREVCAELVSIGESASAVKVLLNVPPGSVERVTAGLEKPCEGTAFEGGCRVSDGPFEAEKALRNVTDVVEDCMICDGPRTRTEVPVMARSTGVVGESGCDSVGAPMLRS